jgi:hypothetical protein
MLGASTRVRATSMSVTRRLGGAGLEDETQQRASAAVCCSQCVGFEYATEPFVLIHTHTDL